MTKCNKILGMFAVLGLSAITMFAQEQGVVINGVTWATRNVDMPGTFADNPESSGMFYQWNRNIGWSTKDPIINSNGGTYWDDTDESGDTWDAVNDPCPSGWRVPTWSEINKLKQFGWVVSIINGVSGLTFGSGDNTIFLPAAGYRVNFSGAYRGNECQYWSSTRNNASTAYHLCFHNSTMYTGSYRRASGLSVRCVKDSSIGVNEVSKDTESATIIGYFDILGKRLNEAPKQEIYIILYDNGKTKKVMNLTK